jgi:alkyl hydroperoxide reductase subunit F
MYDLIIIGGGPAGMTAAVYAARKKLNTLIIAQQTGGQVVTTSWIENYMGYQYVEGLELMDKFEAHLKQFPIDHRDGDEVASITWMEGSFQVEIQGGEIFQSKALIVATGKKARRLNVPGEDNLISRGVSYCAVCDGPLFAGEKVAVIGGGNSALEAIIDLLKIADQVFSITAQGYTGDQVLIDRIMNNPKLRIFHKYEVIEIKGSDRVDEILIQNNQDKKQETLAVRGIFIEIGLVSNSSLVKNLVKLNPEGEIEVNCKCETGIPGLYAAGDVTNIPEKQIIIAAGEGAKAALQANKYLQRLSN